MAKLCQIIAIEKGLKSKAHGFLSELNKAIQKEDHFNGFVKSYEKLDADSEDLPPEVKKMGMPAEELLTEAFSALAEFIQVTARKDWTNNTATATLEIEGVKIPDVPVTHLLFLEKHFTDIRTLVSNTPILSDADEWRKNENQSYYRSEPVKMHRTKKVQRPIVLYDATDHHPAQTQIISEDILAGHWVTVKHSGALPRTKKKELVTRCDKILTAIKTAREEANLIEETKTPQMTALYDYVLAGLK